MRSLLNSFVMIRTRSQRCFAQHSGDPLKLDPKPRKLRLRAGVGFLALDVPIFQLFERDRLPRHRTAHIGAGAAHLEVAVEIFDLRLSGVIRATFVSVHTFYRPMKSRAAKMRGSPAAWIFCAARSMS
jgi:hypothetical protein